LALNHRHHYQEYDDYSIGQAIYLAEGILSHVSSLKFFIPFGHDEACISFHLSRIDDFSNHINKVWLNFRQPNLPPKLKNFSHIHKKLS